MAPAVEHREHIGRRLSDRSMSPVKTRRSPQRRSSPRRERSPSHRRSPERTRSPKRTSSSHKKSPAKEKVPERVKSPKHARGRSPSRTSSSHSPSPHTKRLKRAQTEREPEKWKVGEHAKSSRVERNKGGEREFRDKDRTSASRSPSPRSKRLMRAQAERESDKTKEWEHGRNTSRGEREKGRHGERGEPRDSRSERRPTKDKSDGGSSRSSRRDRSVSPARCDRSVSPEPNHRSKHSSRSPFRVSRDGAREEASRSRTAEQSRDGDVDSIAKMKAAEESLEAKEKDKQKPSYELSGKLAEETNRVRGVTLLFNEPADARKPDLRWRLYVFKSGEVLNEPLYVHRQSCYLFGRERRVADIPTDHPSCSKQHAVIQYRLAEKEQPDGLLSKQSRICNLARELSHLNALVSKHKFQGQHYWDSIAAFCVHHPVKQLRSTWQHRPFDPCYFLLVVKSKDSLSALPCIFAHLILVTLLQKKELMKILVLCAILFVIEGSDSMFMIGSFNKLQ